MSIDEELSFLNGKIEALMYVCSSLLFFHPDAGAIEQTLIGLLTNSNSIETSNVYEEQYLNGVKEISSTLEMQMNRQKWFEKKIVDLGNNIH